jgi:hypothetical protein
MSHSVECPGFKQTCKGNVGLGVHVLKCKKTTRCPGCNAIVAVDQMDAHGLECAEVPCGVCAICEKEAPLAWHIPRCEIDVVDWALEPYNLKDFTASRDYDPQVACARLEAVRSRIDADLSWKAYYEHRRLEMDAQYEAILKPEWSILQVVANILHGIDIKAMIMRKSKAIGKYDCHLYISGMEKLGGSAYSNGVTATVDVDEHGQLRMPKGYGNEGARLKLSDPDSLEPEQLVRFLGLCCGAQNNVGSYKIGQKVAVVSQHIDVLDAD